MENGTSTSFLRTAAAAVAAAFALAVPARAQIMGEIGAYEKGEWNPTAVPEFSVVLCRWGARDSALSGKDLILGQVASIGHTSFTMVLKTPDAGRDTTEVRIDGGVQIFGGGREADCTQCQRRRKYNGTTLVSRTAYNSEICCFTAVFDQIKGASTLKIADMQANGRSVPYMVKFNTQPLLMRNGLKVPIPGKSTLHAASVSVRTVAAAAPPPEETVAAAAPFVWSGTDEFSADARMRALAAPNAEPEMRVEGGTKCVAGPFFAAKGGTVLACEFSASFPNGPNPAALLVEGPGFRLRGMDQVRAFAAAAKACWTEAPRIKAAAGGAMKTGKAFSTAKFPDMEISDGAASLRSPVRAVLVPESGSGTLFVRLETAPSGGGSPREILTTKLDYLPAMLKLVNPQLAMRKLFK